MAATSNKTIKQMMRLTHLITLIIAILQITVQTTVYGQTQTIELKFDSLVTANERYQKQDLTKLKLLNQLAKGYDKVNPEKGIETAELALRLAQKLNNPSEQAAALHFKATNIAAKGNAKGALPLYEQAMAINEKYKNDYGIAENMRGMGRCYNNLSDYNKAMEFYDKSLAMSERLNDIKGIANSLSGIGNVYQNLSDTRKALEKYQKALSINEQLGNRSGMAGNLSNIGNLYSDLGNFTQALEYHQNALNINQQLGNKSGMATNLGNIGNVYGNLADYPKALEYHQKAISIDEQLGNQSGVSRHFINIGVIYRNLSDYTKALVYYQKALNINEKLGNKSYMANILGNIGNVYNNLSDYPKALEFHKKALSIDEQLGHKSGIARHLTNIGIVYRLLSDNNKAIAYQKKALSINEQVGNKSGMAYNLGNIGIVYADLADYSKALEYHQKALNIDEQSGNKSGIARHVNNIGFAYYKLSDYPKAWECFQKALTISEQIKYKSSMAFSLGYMGMVWRDAPDTVLRQMLLNPQERYVKALEYLNRSLQISEQIGEVSKQKYAWNELSTTYEKQGNYTKAFEAYKEYIVLRDSIEGAEVKNKIQQKDMQFEFDKKETELRFQQQLTAEQLQKQQLLNMQQQQALTLSKKEKELQHLAFLKEQAEKQKKEQQLTLAEKDKELQFSQIQSLNNEKALQAAELTTQKQELATRQAQRNLFIAGTVLMLLLAGSVFMGLKRTQKEKKKADNLLHNILPEEVATELKTKGYAKAKKFNEVSVLFTDFANFTHISQQMSPEELVAEIDYCFKAFDEIIEHNGLEKIKTIGDAYMAVCGLPNENANHATKATKAALEIKKWMHAHKNSGGKFDVRIGLSSGPVVAGIVGHKKFQYDIWGDTVNTASRMESSGELGMVNISQSTYELIKSNPDFSFEHRSKIAVKGKGEIDMWFVGNTNNTI